MSHAHSKTFYCKVCNWSGMFPEYRNTEKMDGVATVLTNIPICPECNNDIPIKNVI